MKKILLKTMPGGVMYGITDPEDMTPEERAREMAWLLAKGYLRIWKSAPFQGESVAITGKRSPITGNISNGCDPDESAI
ncbi:MAG: hypothetical protein JSV33_15750 [bacterium]|nr:MAG: hypothetical protein JSV33_15750 [bacterium]